jgi:predicted enzyme related to lactoylglutathione lyase
MPDRSKKVRFNHCAPQFIVQDVARSLEFYKNYLGFEIDYLRGSPPGYAVVYRDDVYIHLCLPESRSFNLVPGCVFIAIRGIDKIWDHIKSTDTEIIDQLAERDFGSDVRFRIFTIKDPDKNVLRIGEKIN